MSESSDNWATIYPIAFLDSEFWMSLSLAEREVFRCIYRFARNERQCYPSQQTLHKHTGISIRGIRKAVRKLEQTNAISVGVHQKYDPSGKPKGRPTNLYKLLIFPLDFKQGGTECRLDGELSTAIRGNSVPIEQVYNRINTQSTKQAGVAADATSRKLQKDYIASWDIFQQCKQIAYRCHQTKFTRPKTIPSHDVEILTLWQESGYPPDALSRAIIWFCATKVHEKTITSLKYIHTIMEQDRWYDRLAQLGGEQNLIAALSQYDLLWFYDELKNA